LESAVRRSLLQPGEAAIFNQVENKEMTLKVKQLHADAILPSRSNPTDAGLDLYALESEVIEAMGRGMVRTGIAVEIPVGYVGLIWPRSGLAVNKGINTLAGVIDADYRGEVVVALHNTDITDDVLIRKGDRVAQLLIQPVALLTPQFFDELSSTDRGESGFGSTGQ